MNKLNKRGLDKNKSGKLFNRLDFRNYLLFVLIIVFIFFNFSLFLEGYSGDLPLFINWGKTALENGISSLYKNSITDYPPLNLYIFYSYSFFLSKILNLSSNYNAFIISHKSVTLFFNSIIILTLFFYLKKQDKTKALIASILYLINFAVVYNSSVWGQVDVLNTLFMLLCVIFLCEKKYLLSSIFMTLSVLAKFQAIVIFPVFLLVLLLDCKFKKWIYISLINLLLISFIFLPFILSGTIPNVIKVYESSIGRYPYVSINAFNLWFISNPKLYPNNLSDNSQFLGLTLKSYGFILLGIYTFFVLYQVYKKRSKENIILASSSLAFAFFMLPTQIHERYLFPFFALMLLIAIENSDNYVTSKSEFSNKTISKKGDLIKEIVYNKNKKYIIIYLLLMILHLFNLMLIVNYNGMNFIFRNIQLFIDFINKIIGVNILGFILSLFGLILFIYYSKIGIFKGIIINLKNDFKTLKKKCYCICK